MDDVPRQKLRNLIEQNGSSLCDNPRRCEGLLRDICGPHKREINVLIAALKAGVVGELITKTEATPLAILSTTLMSRLEDDLAMTPAAARWVVEAWAFALGSTGVWPSDNPLEMQRAGVEGASENIDYYEDQASGLIRTFVGHRSTVYSVVFAPDGRTLLSGSGDKSIKLWNSRTGEVIWSLEETGIAHNVAISPDGRYCLTATWPEFRGEGENVERLSDGLLGLRQLASGGLVRNLDQTHCVRSAAFSPDGKYICADGDNYDLVVWKSPVWKLVRRLKMSEHVSGALAIAPDSRTLVCSYHDAVRLWDLETGILCRTFSVADVNSLAFASDGQTLALATDRTISAWNLKTGYPSKSIHAGTGPILSIAYSPHSNALLSAGGGLLCLWDVTTGGLLGSIESDSRMVSFAPDGRSFVAAGSGGAIEHWALPSQ